VDARIGEVDEPEGTASTGGAVLLLPESPAGTIPFPARLSLTLARSLVAKKNDGG